MFSEKELTRLCNRPRSEYAEPFCFGSKLKRKDAISGIIQEEEVLNKTGKISK